MLGMKLLYAILAGMLLPLAFAPFGIYTIAIISPAILLATWINATPMQAFRRGLGFGLGFFGVGASWVYISIHTYGGAPMPIAAFITFLFVFILSLYPALQGYLLNRLLPKHTIAKCILAFPASYALLEWLRGFVMSGFPWLQLGESQVGAPLQGLAPIIGVYGVTFVVTLTSGVIVACFDKLKRPKMLFPIFLVLAFWSGALAFNKVDWTTPQATPVTITMIQGDIKQEEKWQEGTLEKLLELYPRLTAEHWDSDIIIWPEAAITTTQLQARKFLENLSKDAQAHNSTIILGIPLLLDNKVYNGIYTVGNGSGIYKKRLLVPFGEFTPMKWFFKYFTQWVDIPMSEFSVGSEEQPNINADGLIITPFICYEIAYATEVRKMLRDGTMIVVLTDDSWFGESIAPAQHLQIAQMRALETGRYLLTATNNGITAFITPKGEIQDIAPVFQTAVLTSKVYGMKGNTPWVRMGNVPVVIMLFLLCLLAWRMQNIRHPSA